VFWVLTGVAGVFASYLTVRPNMSVGAIARFIFKTADVPSAGASGALFGLVGVLFVFGIKFRHELPEGFRRAFGTGLLPMIMLNLFIGYMGRGFIDNAAHLGGMVSGAMLALVVDYRRPGERSGIAVTWQVLQIAALALVAVSFVKTAQHLRDPLPAFSVHEMPTAPVTVEPTQPFVSYAKAMNDAQEAFVVAVNDRNPSNIDSAVKGLEAAPHLDQKSDELKEKLKLLLLQAKQASAIAVASPQRDKNKPAQDELSLQFGAWRKEYGQWLRTDGKKHSGLIQLTETESQK
jgi:Rhomboid family